MMMTMVMSSWLFFVSNHVQIYQHKIHAWPTVVRKHPRILHLRNFVYIVYYPRNEILHTILDRALLSPPMMDRIDS